ncbi:MAG: dihydroorotate dehydrogenase-like protein [Pirellulales bacterium]|nr:dihydroorotate dehydrogenase-like protein [Pirellulales bacterium]
MMIDLSTRYLGLSLPNPVVASASPLTGHIDSLRKLEDAGAAAAVLPSLFEEQIEHDALEVQRVYEYGAESFGESLSYFPELDQPHSAPEHYLEKLAQARRAVRIPLIASLNASSPGGWVHYARRIEECGVDALELNVYYVPTDGSETAGDVERRYLDLVSQIRSTVRLPLAVKIGPQFTALPNFCRRLVDAGADGLVLFNRYLEPDIDIDTLELRPNLVLSTPHELGVALRWIAILRDQLSTSLAATGGVHTAVEAIKSLLVGADVVLLASALLKHGAGHVATILKGLEEWIAAGGYHSVGQLRGSMSRSHCPDPSALERVNYMRALVSYTGPL